MSSTRKPSAACLRDALRARAFALLARLSRPLAGPLVVEEADDWHTVRVAVRPNGTGAPKEGVLLLSPEELAIVQALGPDGVLPRKKLAPKSMHQADHPYFKVRVTGLLARNVLVEDEHEQLSWSDAYRTHRAEEP